MTEKAPPFLLALDLLGKSVLVVGSGDEARQRAESLMSAGAQVSVVSPTPDAALGDWALQNHVALIVREPEPQDLKERWLAVLTDRNPSWASMLGRAAALERVFFCAVDQPGFNTFSHVAIAKAGALQVGISSAGQAPAVAAALRRELDQVFREVDLASFVERFASLRNSLDRGERGEILRGLADHIRITGGLDLPRWSEGDTPDPE